jgi:hypothetical protein
LGVIALLVPGFALLKEWAYAGFTFTFIGAFISHLTMNQNQEALMPVVALALLAISYFLRPASRRVHYAVVTTRGYSHEETTTAPKNATSAPV